MAGESWWAMPGPMTDLSAHRAWVEHLPEDIGRLRAAVSQMLIHPALTKLYRLDLDGLRAREVQLRPAADIVDAVFARATGHGSARRATGVCRGFVVVFVAILRQAGVSAGSWCVPATSTRATAGFRRICGALTWCAATSSATAPRSRVPSSLRGTRGGAIDAAGVDDRFYDELAAEVGDDPRRTSSSDGLATPGSRCQRQSSAATTAGPCPLP